jgi:putative MATE family efflux protein
MMLSLPIIGGMLSQNVMNLVDTGMVGSLGDHALAAVGMGSFANFMTTAFITGLSVGVQAMAARRLGEGRENETAISLNGGLALAVMLSIPWTILLVWLTPYFFPYLVSDALVIEKGIPYLQARNLAILGVGMNFAFRGYWNGIDRSGLYLRTIVVIHASNIFLNWVLIYGNLGMPAYGATGAGIATTIATYIGTAYYFIQGFAYARPAGFFRGLPDKKTFFTTLRLAVPNGLQQFFFASGMTVFFWIIGQVGVRELAASNVLVTLMLVGLLPALGFGLATTSLVSQSLGRKDADDAMRWGWDICKIASVAMILITLPGVFFPDFLLGFFLKDPETLALARLPLQLLAGTMFIEAAGRVFMHGLLGAGDNARVMLYSIGLQWLGFLPIAYLLGPGTHLILPLAYQVSPIYGVGMLSIWLAQIGYRVLLTVLFAFFWQDGRWKHIKL